MLAVSGGCAHHITAVATAPFSQRGLCVRLGCRAPRAFEGDAVAANATRLWHMHALRNARQAPSSSAHSKAPAGQRIASLLWRCCGQSAQRPLCCVRCRHVAFGWGVTSTYTCVLLQSSSQGCMRKRHTYMLAHVQAPTHA